MKSFTYNEVAGATGRNLGRFGFVTTGTVIELTDEEAQAIEGDSRFVPVVPTAPPPSIPPVLTPAADAHPPALTLVPEAGGEKTADEQAAKAPHGLIELIKATADGVVRAVLDARKGHPETEPEVPAPGPTSSEDETKVDSGTVESGTVDSGFVEPVLSAETAPAVPAIAPESAQPEAELPLTAAEPKATKAKVAKAKGAGKGNEAPE